MTVRKSAGYGILLALITAVLAGCAGGRDRPIAERIYSLHPEGGPTPQHFVICSGYGCYDRHEVSLSDGQWASVRVIFAPPPANAQAERVLIKRAVARMEHLAGAATGTDADLGGTYSNMWMSHQMDCADETVNTTTYLQMLVADDLLTKHRLGGRLHRGDFFDTMPHMAPTIIDQETGAQWVVDSWYLDNGEPPEIVTPDIWRTKYELWGSTGKPARS